MAAFVFLGWNRFVLFLFLRTLERPASKAGRSSVPQRF
jgi:hypothetical protein